MTTLHLQGADIELNENFNHVRRRLNKAWQLVEDYRNGDFDRGEDDKRVPEPFHLLSFQTLDDDENIGRVMVNLEKVIGVSSDQRTDTEGEEDEDDEE